MGVLMSTQRSKGIISFRRVRPTSFIANRDVSCGRVGYFISASLKFLLSQLSAGPNEPEVARSKPSMADYRRNGPHLSLITKGCWEDLVLRSKNERNPTVSLKNVQAKFSLEGAIQKYSGLGAPIPVFLLTSFDHTLRIAPQ